MKSLCLSLILLFNLSESLAQDVPHPSNYSIVDSVRGDLDKDGVDELVVAYNTEKEREELGTDVPRELIIYKRSHSKWTVWQKSMQALYGSRDGGMMGDPFGAIAIEKGILHISQNGGSSWKWSHTDKYRYDGKVFGLIGYESHHGKLCEYWEDVDFNIVTGKINVKKEYENCETADGEVYKRENETFFKRGILLTLQNRSEKEIKIISPRYKHEIYVAMKNE